MLTPVSLSVADALIYAQSSSAPIAIADIGSNIANNASALVALGAQIVKIQENSATTPFWWPISVANASALAPIMTDFWGNPITFNNITDSANHVIALAGQLGVKILPNGIYVIDTASNVIANTGGLVNLGKKLASITINDTPGHINANQSQLLSLHALKSFLLPDGTLINIKSSDGASVTLSAGTAIRFVQEGLTGLIQVSDYNDAIANNLHALATLGVQLLSVKSTTGSIFQNPISVSDVLALASKLIDLSGNPMTFSHVVDSIANILANTAKLLKLGTQISIGGLFINDSASNILANSLQLQAFKSNIGIGGIVVIDSVANILAQSASLAQFGNSLVINVKDTATTINNNLAKLLALPSSALKGFSLPDGTFINIQSQNASSITLDTVNAINLVKQGLIISLHVVDNYWAIAQNLHTLISLGGQLVSLQTISSYSFFGSLGVNDFLALAPKSLDSAGNPLVFKAINDTAGNVADHAGSLLALVGQIGIGAIQITDSASQVAGNVALIKPLGLALSVTVYDSPANINAYQTQLMALGTSFKAIKLPDGTSICIQSTDNLSITLSVRNAITFVQENLTAPLHVVDYLSNIASNASALVQLGTQLLSIQNTTNALFDESISVANLIALAPKLTDSSGSPVVFSNIIDSANNIGAYSVQLTALGLQIPDGSIHIKDTAINVANNLKSLLALASKMAVGGVNVTDSITNILSNAQQFALLGSALSVNVADTIDAINAHLSSLLSLGISIKSLSLPNGTVLNVQSEDKYVLSVNTSTALAFVNSSISAPFRIVDFGDNIASNMDILANIGSQLVSIQETSGAPTFSWPISVADLLALAPKMLNAQGNPDIFNQISDTVANVITQSSKLLALNSRISDHGISILDNAANVATNSYGLIKLGNKLGMVNVSDTASNINAYLYKIMGLKASLGSFILPDGSVLFIQSTDGKSVTVDAVTALAFVAEKLSVPLHVQDTGDVIAGLLHDLSKMGSQRLSLQDTSDTKIYPYAISATDVVALASKMTDAVGNRMIFAYVVDSVTNVTSKLYGLQAIAGQIGSIAFNNISPRLSVSSSMLISYATVFKKVSGVFLLTVSGVSAGNVATMLALTVGSSKVKPTSISVYDTAANLSINLDTLQTNLTKISAISAMTTDLLPVTFYQLSADAGVLAKMYNITGLAVSGVSMANLTQVLAVKLGKNTVSSVAISDTSGSVFSALAAINANLSKITAISLIDSPNAVVVLTANQALANGTIFNLLTNAFHLTITGASVSQALILVNNPNLTAISITDNAQTLLTQLDSLQAISTLITGINLSDTSTPTITLSSAQLLNDSGVLAKILGAYQVAVSPVSANALAVAIANSHVLLPLQLADTAANVSAVLDTAQAAGNKLATIHLTDTSKPTITITSAQYVADALALGKILSTDTYSLSLSNETVVNVTRDLAYKYVVSVGVQDSLANVMKAVNTTLLKNVAKISQISLTDAGTPAIALSAWQYATDLPVLNKISSPYFISISNETVNHVSADALNSHVSAIGVVDSAIRVASNLNVLQSNLGILSGISLTDLGTPKLQLSSAQIASNFGALNSIKTPYLLSVKDTVAAINGLDLGLVKTTLIELMPTWLNSTLIENQPINDLNLSLINLSNNTIIVKAYQSTGTEVDIMAGGHMTHQLLFMHDKPSDLQLLGIGATPVQVF